MSDGCTDCGFLYLGLCEIGEDGKCKREQELEDLEASNGN